MQQRCPNCGSPIAPGQRFCGGCGAQISLACPQCRITVSPGTRFCPSCGSTLGGGAPQQPGWGQQPGGMPPQQPGWGQQPGGMPPQQPGWGQQPGWAPPAPRRQSSSSRPLLVILLIVLLIGLGGLTYWQFGDRLLAFVKSATGGTSSTVDTTKPEISDFKVTASTMSAIITWKTNELANSQVAYGKTNEYGSLSPLLDDPTTGETGRVVTHSITLTGLESNTPYHYKIMSRDEAGNLGESGDKTFTTTVPEA